MSVRNVVVCDGGCGASRRASYEPDDWFIVEFKIPTHAGNGGLLSKRETVVRDYCAQCVAALHLDRMVKKGAP